MTYRTPFEVRKVLRRMNRAAPHRTVGANEVLAYKNYLHDFPYERKPEHVLDFQRRQKRSTRFKK